MGKTVPRSFSGEENSDGMAKEPGKWLKHYEKVCRANDWEADAEKVDRLPLYLEGEVADWCEINQAWMMHDDRTWVEVKMRFLRRFRPEDYEDEIKDRLC